MARAGVTADRLTRAAVELADEISLENVTVSALARRFGVTVASLYSHIRNADDLKTRMATLALTELADRVAAALAGRSGKDALVAFANAYRDYARTHPGRYAAARLRLDPDAGTELVDAARRHTELTAAILRGYRLPDTGRTAAVRLLHSTFHGFVSLEAAGGFSYSGDVDDSWSTILDALDRTLRSWP